MVRALFFIATRSVFFFALLTLASVAVVDYSKVFVGEDVRSFHFFKPSSFEYLVKTYDSGKQFDKYKLRKYIYYYNKASEYMPSPADAFGMLGFCYFEAGQIRKAVAAYKQSVRINPKFFWSRYNLGVIFFKEGRLRAASKWLKSALDIAPPVTLNFIGSSQRIYKPVLSARGMWSGQGLLRSLRDGQKDCFSLLCIVYYQLGDFKAMEEAAHAAVKLNVGGKEFFHYCIGLAAYRLGEYKKAIAYFKDAVKNYPDDFSSYYYLGKSFKSLGMDELAAEPLMYAQMLKKLPKRDVLDEVLGSIRIAMF